MRMNKNEIIEGLVKYGVADTKKDAMRISDGFLDFIIDSVAEGNDVVFSGRMAFMSKEVAERECHNPSTGEMIVVPAHHSMKFKLGKVAKKRINNEAE